MRALTRGFSGSTPLLQYCKKYDYYRLVSQSGKLQRLRAVEAEKERLQPEVFVFSGNTDSTKSTIRRMRNVFGGRLTGEKASKTSSRYFQTPTYMIGGIQVPSKPVEPDNCCMSGCVNCVWELFNDDLKEYKAQRKLAAESLRAHGGVWPLKYNPPVSMLNMENLPEEIRNKSPQEIDEIISDQQYYDNSDRWESVLMSAFADFERKLHKEHETRQRN